MVWIAKTIAFGGRAEERNSGDCEMMRRSATDAIGMAKIAVAARPGVWGALARDPGEHRRKFERTAAAVPTVAVSAVESWHLGEKRS